MIPQKLEQLIEPALADLGFECVRIRYTGGGGKSARGQLQIMACLLYTSPSPRDLSTSRMPSSA